jgi:hypothetical protein
VFKFIYGYQRSYEPKKHVFVGKMLLKHSSDIGGGLQTPSEENLKEWLQKSKDQHRKSVSGSAGVMEKSNISEYAEGSVMMELLDARLEAMEARLMKAIQQATAK